MAEIDYSKRNDSGQYYLSINGLKDKKGYLSELQEVEHLKSAVVGIWKNTKERIRVREVKLVDANTGLIVGFSVIPYDVILNKGDSLTVTFIRPVTARPRGADISV